MASTVVIEKTTMSFRVPVTTEGILRDAPVSCIGFVSKLSTTKFDHKLRRPVLWRRYRYYNKKTGKLHMPLYLLQDFIEFLRSNGVPHAVVKLKPPPGKDIDISLNPKFKPRDERQADAVDHLINSPDEVKGISLQTGVGKTVTTLAFIAARRKRALIGVQGIISQWTDAIYEWTDLKPEDVYIIKGADSIAKLLSQIDKKIFPKIIIYSIASFRGWSLDSENYENYPDFSETCENLDVGIRVVDEGHLNFYANFIVDIRLNTAETILLTATFDVSDRDTRDIFDKHYPPRMRFGEDSYKKYVNITAFSYASYDGAIQSRMYTRAGGYSHVMFENWYLNKKRTRSLEWWMRVALFPMVFEKYVSIRAEGQKLLVLCETLGMCDAILNAIIKKWPEFKTAKYTSSMDNDVLADNDIIVSTNKSSGTARDIPHLRTVIQTTSVKSRPQNMQNLGRLRELKGYPADKTTPEFVYLYDRSVNKQVEFAEERRAIFFGKGASFSRINV